MKKEHEAEFELLRIDETMDKNLPSKGRKKQKQTQHINSSSLQKKEEETSSIWKLYCIIKTLDKFHAELPHTYSNGFRTNSNNDTTHEFLSE